MVPEDADSFRLPEMVHDQAEYRVWQHSFSVMNIFTEKKRLEKVIWRLNERAARRLQDRLRTGKPATGITRYQM